METLGAQSFLLRRARSQGAGREIWSLSSIPGIVLCSKAAATTHSRDMD